MSNMQTPSPDNLLLGSGALFIDLLVNGQRTGERHLGNVESFSLSTTDETREKYESMTSMRGLYKSVTVRRDIVLNVVGSEFSPENLALNAMGSVSTETQAGGTVTSKLVTASAKPGFYYALGHRHVDDVEVSVGGVEAEEGVDYTVDTRAGRIYIVPGGGISAGSEVTASYTYAERTFKTVEGGTEAVVEAALRFVGDPAAGPAVEVEVYRAQITPEGELGFISDDFGNWTLNCKVLADQSRPAGTSPYYRVIYL